MSRNVYRLATPCRSAGLSLTSAPGVKQTLVALKDWIRRAGQRELVEVQAKAPIAPLNASPSLNVSPLSSTVTTTRPIAVHRTPPTLKVVVVRDQHNADPYSARVVISGRMADVCAQLDRMAA